MAEEKRGDVVDDCLRLKRRLEERGGYCPTITAEIPVDDPENPDEKALAMAEKARRGGIEARFTKAGTTELFFFQGPSRSFRVPDEGKKDEEE
jgi:hypothetical protein